MPEFIRRLFQKDRYFFITFMYIDVRGINYANTKVHAKNGMISDGITQSLLDQHGTDKATILFIYPISKKEFLANVGSAG